MPIQATPWISKCAPLFSYTHYTIIGTVDMGDSESIFYCDGSHVAAKRTQRKDVAGYPHATRVSSALVVKEWGSCSISHARCRTTILSDDQLGEVGLRLYHHEVHHLRPQRTVEDCRKAKAKEKVKMANGSHYSFHARMWSAVTLDASERRHRTLHISEGHPRADVWIALFIISFRTSPGTKKAPVPL